MPKPPTLPTPKPFQPASHTALIEHHAAGRSGHMAGRLLETSDVFARMFVNAIPRESR